MSIEVEDAACPVLDAVSLRYYSSGGDNSTMCWLTNYLLVAALVGSAAFLLRAKHPAAAAPRAPLLDNMRLLLVGKFAFSAASVLCAGLVHQGLFGPAGEHDKGFNHGLWLVVCATLLLSGAPLACAALNLFARIWLDGGGSSRDPWLRGSRWAVVTSFTLATAVGSFTSRGLQFFVCALMGEMVPNLALLLVLMSRSFVAKAKATSSGYLSMVSLLTIYAGAFVQKGLGPLCGIPCPVHCPLPAPSFNHNAFFHVLHAVGVVLLALGMDAECGGGAGALAGKPGQKEV